MAKKPTDKDTIRKIWLAGIGAYGRAYSEAKGAMDSLTGKGSEVFDELVQKGEMLEAVGKYKAGELVGKGKAAAADMKPNLDIDDRIAKMRARLSGTMEKSEDRLAARVDQLEAKIDAILERLDIGDAPAAKPATKTSKSSSRSSAKTATKKTVKAPSKKKMTTERTPKQKTTAKKAATQKSTAKKTPASEKTNTSSSKKS